MGKFTLRGNLGKGLLKGEKDAEKKDPHLRAFSKCVILKSGRFIALRAPVIIKIQKILP
ncbi:MAG: hypothetical protein LBE27_00960 [Deltaproteobacteria bacterium]|jgi:hypothetical protein|nr:hypothetical protein [Deltaproteobacteria bacterium]